MMNQSLPDASQGTSLSALIDSQSRRRFSWRVLALAGAILLVAGFGLQSLVRSRRAAAAAAPRYTTERAVVGKLVVKVSATGNLQPTNKVDVGSEISGLVVKVFFDDNDRVRKGQVLAQLDLAKLKDAVAKSRAALAAADAQVLQAEATVAEARAALARYRQVSQLSGGKVPSQAEMVGAEANLKRAEANLAAARAAVVQARANLQSDDTNLSKATIRSPIDGVVLTRKVEPGQTVAAALQAPTLFTIAEDLAKMELQVDIDEADVAQVQVGQQATFGVDAWPGRKYHGGITRVGYGSQTKDGVVSYPAVIAVANDDLSLRPGMTATAEIVTVMHDGVLLVPNAALRFTPTPAVAPAGPPSSGLLAKLLPRPPGPSPKAAPPTPVDGKPRLWLLASETPVPLEVQTGESNGQTTEIVGGALQAGADVITETANAQP